MKAYIDPLRTMEKKDPILTAAEMSKIFSSIALILNVNEELLNSLEKRYGETITPDHCVGDVFLELVKKRNKKIFLDP